MVKTDSSYFCFCCGTKYQLNEMKYCERCGELFFPIDDDFICKDCMDGQIMSDDVFSWRESKNKNTRGIPIWIIVLV